MCQDLNGNNQDIHERRNHTDSASVATLAPDTNRYSDDNNTSETNNIDNCDDRDCKQHKNTYPKFDGPPSKRRRLNPNTNTNINNINMNTNNNDATNKSTLPNNLNRNKNNKPSTTIY